MAKSLKECQEVLESIVAWTTPRLVFIVSANSKTSGLTQADLENPANWVEATGKGTTSRPDLSGAWPVNGDIVSGDGGGGKKLTLPKSQVTVSNMPAQTVVALAIVNGTSALASTTEARVVDISDVTYSSGETAIFDANAWVINED